MNLASIQQALADSKLDGWLFYDFRGSDPLTKSILGLPSGKIQSRRWFYFVPVEGEPTKLVHAIESGALDALPGSKKIYLPWPQLHSLLAEILAGRTRVAMQYSPNNAIPYISRVDAGTVELIRSLGVEIVSSADLAPQFEATMTEEQWESQRLSAEALGILVDESFVEIGRRLGAGEPTTEYDIQQFMMAGFARRGLIADHPPIVAVNAHSADPHYIPTESGSAPIRRGDFVLIDTWAKFDRPGTIYGDITWVAFVGEEVPEFHRKIFNIVRDARDAAIEAVRAAQSSGKPIRGCDVDDVCRAVIVEAGYGERFIHRTGHSIHETGHGNGANIDNLETRDERTLIPRTCFSIEPGIYLPGQFGVRSEVDVFLPDETSTIVSGPPPQREIVRIL